MDSVAFDFQALFHTYFNIHDIKDMSVYGLQGCTYADKVTGILTNTEERNAITIAGEVDRVYANISNKTKIRIKNVTESLGIDINRINLPDVVVWNPWIEKARHMSDFGDDEYVNMVCVEPGHVHDYVTLEPSQRWSGCQQISCFWINAAPDQKL